MEQEAGVKEAKKPKNEQALGEVGQKILLEFVVLAKGIDTKEKAEKAAEATGGIVMLDDDDPEKYMVVSSYDATI